MSEYLFFVNQGDETMYARVTTTQFSPYRLDEAISIIRDHTVPAAQKQIRLQRISVAG